MFPARGPTVGTGMACSRDDHTVLRRGGACPQSQAVNGSAGPSILCVRI